MREAIAEHWPDKLLEINSEKFSEEWLGDSRRVQWLHQLLDKFFTSPELLRAQGKEQVARLVTKMSTESNDVSSFAPLNEIEMAQHIQHLFESLAEGELLEPTFIKDFPKPVSPLSKASPDNPSVAERFELYIMKMEVANGFSELNDPEEQYQRFEEQTRQRERGDDEAMQMDLDYVRALSYGMPPAAGIGIGIDRLTMLLTNRRSIRDVILFPHMRPQRQAEEDPSKDVPLPIGHEDREHSTGEQEP